MENQQENISPEELVQRREALNAHYKETVPFLKKQLEYEELLTKIEETRANRFMIQVKVAQYMAPDPEEEPLPDSAGDPASRKLKKA
jgi:hypothetical protein